MLTSLTFVVSTLTLVVGVLAVWLAIWSYRRLSITVFAWIAATKLVGGISAWVSVAPKPEKIDQAVKQLQALAERMDVPLGQMVVSIMYFSHLFPLLVTFSLGVVAVSEATHIVSTSDPTFLPHPVFRLTYRIRWVFGLMAILAKIAPSAILYYSLQSLP
jgi:hypothetical protein